MPSHAGKLLLLCGLATIGACASLPQQALIGTWKSDAPRTLEAMRAHGAVPPEARAAYEADYYGHLIIEYRVDTVRARFDNRAYDSGYQPYEVVGAGEDYVVTREWNEVTGQFQQTTTYRDGDCLYGLSSPHGFREYFCPFTR